MPVLGVLFAGVFLAVVASYACTEYQLVLFDAWRRVMTGTGFALLILLGANLVSFLVLWVSASVFVLASGTHYYAEAAAICGFAQAVWLGQHLWFYYRNHLRLRYKS
jgi:hypothetical protein